MNNHLKFIFSLCALVLLTAVGVVTWRVWVQPENGHKTTVASMREVPFSKLPGWKSARLLQSMRTFQTSCKTFIKQDPERVVGTDQITLQVKDWQPACVAALQIDSTDEQAIKAFFEKWFVPVEFFDSKPVKGLFTGYYLPSIKGSYTQSQEFNIPLYEAPKNLVSVDLGLFQPQLKNMKIVGRVDGNHLLPYYTREQINQGAIKNAAKVLLWVNNPVDRLFLEIQGSGIVELEDGKEVYVGYDGQNGHPYTALASVLIRKGVLTKENASMQSLRQYLMEHPEEQQAIINQNKSFVFF